MGKKKSKSKTGCKLKQTVITSNLSLRKAKDIKSSPIKAKKTKVNEVSPPKSPKARGRPKPQAKASAKLKISAEDKENENDVDNNNVVESPIMVQTRNSTQKSPEKAKSPPKNTENSPTNNNLKSTPSKMSPRKDKSATPESPAQDLISSGALPLPDRPSSPRKSPGSSVSGSSSPVKVGECTQGTGFKCKVCPKWFPNRYFQRKHMLMTHEDELYECRVCSFASVDPQKLKSHITKLHIPKKEKSDMCQDNLQIELDKLIDKKVPRKVMMEDGVALGRDVITKMRYVCALCSRVYTSKYSLERHVRCHTLEKPYQCDVCPFSSSYREHMMRHITSVHLIVHSDAPKAKYNPKKKKDLDASDSSNDQTIKSEESSPEKKRRNILRERFECAVCSMRATHKTDLMEHIRTKHPNAHIESLVNKDGSKVHLIVTNAKKNKKATKRLTIQCTYCSLIFHDTWKYKVHLRSHTGVKPFICSVCDFCATSKMTIRDHIHRKHKQADNAKIILRTVGIDGNVEKVGLNVPWREFKCEICDTVCDDKYTLKIHKNNLHPEFQPFSCADCYHKEKVKANMIIHCNEKHPDKNIDELVLRHGKLIKVGSVKLPTCDFCSKTFAYQSQLNIHTRLHTGEKELSCTHCDYQTNSKVVMSQHILKKHFGHEISSKTSSKAKSKKAKASPKKKAKLMPKEISDNEDN